MTRKSDRPGPDRSGIGDKGEKAGWTGKAALAGAAIGSAALAAALLYASHRKERAEKAARAAGHGHAPETD